MSILVSWTALSAGPLNKGIWPDGLTHTDFDRSPDDETEKGVFISRFNGDPLTIANYGMTEYTYPAPRELVITSISGVGFRSWDGASKAVVKKNKLITITATLPGTAGIWSTPVLAPDGVVELFETERLLDTDLELTFSVILDKSGIYKMTQELLNQVSDDGNVKFAGLDIYCQLPNA